MARIERTNKKYRRADNKAPLDADDFGRGRCRNCGEDEVEGGLDGGKCLYCGHENEPWPSVEDGEG